MCYHTLEKWKIMTGTQMGKPYRMDAIYAIHDRISHPGYGDEGVVTEVHRTSDKHFTCTVDFAKVGRKRLIMGLNDSAASV